MKPDRTAPFHGHEPEGVPLRGFSPLRARLGRVFNPEKWSLSARFLYATGALLAVGSVTLVLVFLYYRGLILSESVNSRMAVFEQWIQDKLASQQDLLYSEVVPVASMPEVVAALHTRDRERLKSFILPYMERIRTISGLDAFYYHFHLPPAVSFLRTWDLENTGADLTAIRPMVVKANKYVTPLKGIEVGPGGVVIRAIVPVLENGLHLGSVEVAASVEGILHTTQMPSHFGATLLLERRFGDIVLPNHPMSPHGRWLVGKTMNTAEDQLLLAELDSGRMPQRVGNVFYRALALEDFQAQPVGVVLLSYDSGALVGSTVNEALIFGLAFACGAITLLFLLYSNVRRVKQFLTRLQRILVATNEGNFSERFETEPIHCLEVLRCHKTDCPVYENPSLICYLETGSEAIFPAHRNTCVFLRQYRKCRYCPVHALRRGDELVEMRNSVNTMLRLWGVFTNRVHQVIGEVLHTKESAERTPSLNHITETLEHMAGLTAFTRDLQGVISKEEVYAMLEHVFTRQFQLPLHAIFEADPADGRMAPAVNRFDDPALLCTEMFQTPSLCRARRVVDEVSSHVNHALCPYFHIDHERFVRCCLPMVMGGQVGGVASFVLPRAQWEKRRLSLSVLQKYLSECAPVISTLQLLHVSKENAMRDALTGVHNRRFLDEYVKKYEAVARRDARMVGFVMVDVDHFKRLNDQHGHLAGDAILRDLARLLQDRVRKADLVVRFGGEEFLVLLHEVLPGHAREVAEKLRLGVESHPFMLPDGRLAHMTVSLGVSEFPSDAEAFHQTIKCADLALYRAKEQGRNRVVQYEAQTPVGADA